MSQCPVLDFLEATASFPAEAETAGQVAADESLNQFSSVITASPCNSNTVARNEQPTPAQMTINRGFS